MCGYCALTNSLLSVSEQEPDPQKAWPIAENIKWLLSKWNPKVRSRRSTGAARRLGKAEQYIKEGKNTIKWTRLSCRKFRNNEVRLQLHALAYNLANFMRTLALSGALSECPANLAKAFEVYRGHRPRCEIVGHF